MARVAIVAVALLAATAQALKAKQDVGDQVLSAIQGAMLLAQALPHDDGPKPTKAMQAKMDQAGPLIYSAYSVLNNGQESAEGATEQLRTGIRASGSAQDIATAEAFLQRGQEKLRKGEALSQQAKSDFMSKADPLGPQPQQPKDWDSVDAMSRRAQTRLTALKEKINEAKTLARRSGVSLISVASEKVSMISGDAYANQREDKILDFLSKY